MIPSAVDLRPDIDLVEDQGMIGSCTAEGVHKAYEVALERQGRYVNLSPLYLYYWARADIGWQGKNGVRSIFDTVTSMVKRGTCEESLWPYRESYADTKPPVACDDNAAKYKPTGYRIPMSARTFVHDLKTWLAQGKPIITTIGITDSFIAGGEIKDWRTFDYDPVGSFKNTYRGLHCVLVIGYDDEAQRFLVQNSWGPRWGDGGFFGLKYDNPHMLQTCILDLPFEYVNAGWSETPLEQFDRMMDWAEVKFALPHEGTNEFAQYLYRKYGETYVGLDRQRDEFVKYESGAFHDLGQRSYWLGQM